jgi:hypothetical protein
VFGCRHAVVARLQRTATADREESSHFRGSCSRSLLTAGSIGRRLLSTMLRCKSLEEARFARHRHRSRQCRSVDGRSGRGEGAVRRHARLDFQFRVRDDNENGLGVALLNSNAETHFSFTNALGLIAAEQPRALAAIARSFPRARWIVALHHHLVEYPMPAAAFSERIGTALHKHLWDVQANQQRPAGKHRGGQRGVRTCARQLLVSFALLVGKAS